jgi:hypothetical protein
LTQLPSSLRQEGTPGKATVEKPLVYFDLGTGTIESRKKTKEAATMLGPAGLSYFRDPKRTDQTEAMPMNLAITAICSGDVEKRCRTRMPTFPSGQFLLTA